MAPSNMQNSNDPLLGGPPKLLNDPSTQSLSITTQTAMKALSVIRIATGAACLIAPRFTCAMFKYNVPAEQALLVRMFGSRDAILGELLLTADDKTSGGRREIRRAFWAGIACDVFDLGSVVYALAMGQVGRTTAGLFGAAAISAIGLGAVGLKGL